MARPLKPATPFGERLIQARGKMGREAAAAALGIQANTLGDYERGRTSPNPDLLARIGDVYGVSLDWLIAGRGEMRNNVTLESAAVDDETLEASIQAVEEFLRARGQSLPPDKKAALITTIYSMMMEDDAKMVACTPATIARLVRLASGG